MMVELKTCPNCGTDRITMINRPHRPYGFPVTENNKNDRELFCKCTVCGFETAPSIAGYNALTKHTTTVDQAKHIALDRWQKRETRYLIRKRIFGHYPGQEEYEKKRAELIRQGRLQPWD